VSSAATWRGHPDAWLASLFGALSTRLGGDATPLEEAAILRLVEAARAGDRAAGQRLYQQHVDRVYRTVRGLLRSDADAEEVTQDALLNMLTHLNGYTPRSGTRFAAWVTTIAVNTAHRRFRRRRPESADPNTLPQLADDSIDLEGAADAARQRAALLAALAELPDRERQILSMRYGAELDAAEIARALTLDAANVRKILERARERLGARIEALLKSTGEPT